MTPRRGVVRELGMQVFKLGGRPRLFSPYNVAYWCANCQTWILKEKAVEDRRGSPACPFCGKKLRVKARKRCRK